MIFPEVRYLYKYTSVNDNSLGIFIKDEFWFAKPDTFNDPLDCGIQLINNISKEKFLEKSNEYLRYLESSRKPRTRNPQLTQKIKSVKEVITKVKMGNALTDEILDSFAKMSSESYSKDIKNIGILSLSEVNENILMWSHYADQHRGFCIELERNKGSDLADNKKTLPVRYSIKKPDISIEEHEQANKDEEKEIRRSLIYTKSVDWNYEREWRVIQDIGNKSYKINAKINSVIFGLKTPEHSIKTIYELFNKTGLLIKFRRARLKEKDFGIEIVDFDPNLMIFNDEIKNDLSSPTLAKSNTAAKLPNSSPSLAPAKLKVSHP